MKRVWLIATEELPCPGSHYLHTKKFLQAFASFGYLYEEIRISKDIDLVNSNDIVYISNHGLNDLEKAQESIEKLGKRKAQYILWFWHDYLDLAVFHFNDRFVLTGEHFRKKPLLAEHLSRWNIQQMTDRYLPLTFASKLNPDEIGSLARLNRYLAHFIGAHYKKSWNRILSLNFKKIMIINTPPFISEKQREQIFLSSGVALGWHSDSNISNQVIVERVFEGMAYGCFVVSDNPVAQEITDGIVEIANSYLELRDWIVRFKKDQNFRVTKQSQGYAWSKDFGTYTHVAKGFLKHLEITR